MFRCFVTFSSPALFVQCFYFLIQHNFYIIQGWRIKVSLLLGFKLYSDGRSDPYCLTRQVKVVELKVTWITKSYSPKGSDSVYPPPSTITQENLCRSAETFIHMWTFDWRLLWTYLLLLQWDFIIFFFAAIRSEMTLWCYCVGLGQGAAPGVLRPHSEAAGREGPLCFPGQARRHTYHLWRSWGCPCPAGGPCG